MRAIYVIALVALAGCSDPDRARAVLEAQGYTEIVTAGYAYFGCSDDDVVQNAFRATSPGGQRIEGVVCCGYDLPFSKGCTVRVDP